MAPKKDPNLAGLKEPYPYTHLRNPTDDIRLLVLQPRSSTRGGGPPICNFAIRPLYLADSSPTTKKAATRYEALSYAWKLGERMGSARIWDAGRVLAYTVKTFKTLESCLKRLRYTDKERYLWVHSLCINQMDDDEKSDQVIYHWGYLP